MPNRQSRTMDGLLYELKRRKERELDEIVEQQKKVYLAAYLKTRQVQIGRALKKAKIAPLDDETIREAVEKEFDSIIKERRDTIAQRIADLELEVREKAIVGTDEQLRTAIAHLKGLQIAL